MIERVLDKYSIDFEKFNYKKECPEHLRCTIKFL